MDGTVAAIDLAENPNSVTTSLKYQTTCSPVNALCHINGSTTVWSGTEQGKLLVWRFCPMDGGLAAEEIYHREGVRVKYKTAFRKWKEKVRLVLSCGVLEWSAKGAPITLAVRDITGVIVKRNGLFGVTTKEGQKVWYASSEEKAARWVDVIEVSKYLFLCSFLSIFHHWSSFVESFCHKHNPNPQQQRCRLCLSSKKLIMQIAQQQLTYASKTVSIIHINEIDGMPWTVDSAPRVCFAFFFAFFFHLLCDYFVTFSFFSFSQFFHFLFFFFKKPRSLNGPLNQIKEEKKEGSKNWSLFVVL